MPWIDDYLSIAIAEQLLVNMTIDCRQLHHLGVGQISLYHSPVDPHHGFYQVNYEEMKSAAPQPFFLWWAS